MADFRITHVRKKDRMNTHEHITHVGNLINPDPNKWIWPREDVIASIDAKTNTFHVIDAYNGKRSDVGVVRPAGRPAYLRTHADGDWNDNLLSLPEC